MALGSSSFTPSRRERRAEAGVGLTLLAVLCGVGVRACLLLSEGLPFTVSLCARFWAQAPLR